jgi:hypothetical protein
MPAGARSSGASVTGVDEFPQHGAPRSPTAKHADHERQGRQCGPAKIESAQSSLSSSGVLSGESPSLPVGALIRAGSRCPYGVAPSTSDLELRRRFGSSGLSGSERSPRQRQRCGRCRTPCECAANFRHSSQKPWRWISQAAAMSSWRCHHGMRRRPGIERLDASARKVLGIEVAEPGHQAVGARPQSRPRLSPRRPARPMKSGRRLLDGDGGYAEPRRHRCCP